MQTSSPAFSDIMKNFQLSCVFLLLVSAIEAQQLTGLWMGKMLNDSNTVRKDDEYEIVLTQYRSKVYGYTRNTFFVGDNLYYIVKKVEGEINGNICEIKDAGIIMHNFPQRPEKKVKVSYVFRRSPTDSTWNLDGEWKTNTTKNYYSISGKSDLSQEKDLSRSKIFPHLEELNQAEEIAFYKEWKQEKETAVAGNDNTFKQEFLKSRVRATREENNLTIRTTPAGPATTSGKTAIHVKEIVPEEKKSTVIIAKQDGEEKKTELNPVIINTSGKKAGEPIVAKAETKPKNAQPEKSKPVIADPQPVAKTTAPVVQPPPAIKPETKIVASQPLATELKQNTVVTDPDAAKEVADRNFEKPQEVFFTSDSIVLALYDNGEVDGDTVSVLLNGEVIIARQCLKTTAFKKTIYIPSGDYQANIVLYAENLGSYPPNTGLLVVYDGEERYNVRFSADLKKNAAIILKRKK